MRRRCTFSPCRKEPYILNILQEFWVIVIFVWSLSIDNSAHTDKILVIILWKILIRPNFCNRILRQFLKSETKFAQNLMKICKKIRIFLITWSSATTPLPPSLSNVIIWKNPFPLLDYVMCERTLIISDPMFFCRQNFIMGIFIYHEILSPLQL